MAGTAMPVGSGVSVPSAVLPVSLAGQSAGGPASPARAGLPSLAGVLPSGPVAAPSSPAPVAPSAPSAAAPLRLDPAEPSAPGPACDPPSGAVLDDGDP